MRSFEALAACAAAHNMPLMAARLLGAADRLREAMGVYGKAARPKSAPQPSPASDDSVNDARLAAAWQEGRAWSITYAVAVAMSV